MPLLYLPNELLLCIAQNLELKRDTNALARTNRRLHNVLNDYLYCHGVAQFGSSALFWALKHGRETTAQKLIGAGANVQVRDFDGYTPLLLAAKYGYNAV